MSGERLFICYRREDSAGYAGRLYDRLVVEFGERNVFMDVDHIEYGDDFQEVLSTALMDVHVVLVLIGPTWNTTSDRTGLRRLLSEEDFVRKEIETAIASETRIIPVLVGGATVPSSTDLPSSLAPLTRRHAAEVSNHRFNEDVRRLIDSIKKNQPTQNPVATTNSPSHDTANTILAVAGKISTSLRARLSARIWIFAFILAFAVLAIYSVATYKSRDSALQTSSAERAEGPALEIESKPTVESPPPAILDTRGSVKPKTMKVVDPKNLPIASPDKEAPDGTGGPAESTRAGEIETSRPRPRTVKLAEYSAIPIVSELILHRSSGPFLNDDGTIIYADKRPPVLHIREANGTWQHIDVNLPAGFDGLAIDNAESKSEMTGYIYAGGGNWQSESRVTPVIWRRADGLQLGGARPQPTPPTGWRVRPEDHNRRGEVVGQQWTLDGNSHRGFYWSPDTNEFVYLSPLVSDGHWLEPAAINNRGQVTGSSGFTGNSRHAFLWDRDLRRMVDLGSLGGRIDYSEGTDINDDGVVVGSSSDMKAPHVPFIWHPSSGQMQSLANCGPDLSAHSINNRAEVLLLRADRSRTSNPNVRKNDLVLCSPNTH